jgi:aquaporin Z
MSIARKCAAEFIGTFYLVLCGCGSAVLAAAFPDVGIGLLGVSFAFGLTVLAMAYTVGHISGCHINPAVSIRLLVAKRFPRQELIPYVIAQVAGAVVFAGGWALGQLWFFWVVPILGGIAGALIYNFIGSEET